MKIEIWSDVICPFCYQNQQIAAQYQIRSVPTLAIFKNGEVKWRQSGVFPASELERLIKENL